MIRKFIDKLLGKGEADAPAKGRKAPRIPLGKRTEVPVEVHGIDGSLLDERAVKVVRTLKDAGHEAYIVGGAVRDLLVNRRPKDFDVATNATPEEVKALFRRAFIIGRRFRIVHVVFGRGRDHEVIEVSTFRAYMDAQAADQASGDERTSQQEMAGKSHVVDASGRVLRDNVWGPQIEDAARRDFTVNAMYYEPQSQIVVDYHGGLADAKARVLRMIGDPETRYREDPVRIIRVLRFSAKLGFTIEPKTEKPIAAMSALLSNVPPSRLFDEMIKLLQTGHALASVEQLRQHKLQKGVFPLLDLILDETRPDEARLNFVRLAMADTDRRVNDNKAVAPSFLLACMLWHDVLAGWNAAREQGEPATPALQTAIAAVFDARIGDISGRGKLAMDMREIWLMQPRFERRTGHQPYTLVEQPRFRAAFDFMRLRADAGEISHELADWWEDFSLGNDAEREALLELARPSGKGRQGAQSGGQGGQGGPQAVRRNPPRAAAPAGDLPPDAEVADPPAPAAKKRRRRRRKPSGGAGADGGSRAAAKEPQDS